MWVTVIMERRLDSRTFRRRHTNELKYYPTRPWIYKTGEPNVKISLQKRARSFEFSLVPCGQACVTCHANMEQVLRRSTGPRTYSIPCTHRGIPPDTLLYHYLCPFMMGTRRPLHPKPEQCILSLSTFAVTLDSFDIPVTIILLYALAPRVGNECFPRRSVSLAHICPNMHPEYHHEIRVSGQLATEVMRLKSLLLSTIRSSTCWTTRITATGLWMTKTSFEDSRGRGHGPCRNASIYCRRNSYSDRARGR